MKLPFFSSKFVQRLRESAGANAVSYGSDTSWIERFSAGQKYMYESSQVVDPPPQLLFDDDDNPRHDAENARRVFLWLEKLTPALAMEERLWACLTHCTFAAYMAQRWPASGANAVQRRYLFEGKSFASLSRNGIARLWWAGFLTRDKARANQFELTEALFMRQDIHVSLLERSMGKCRTVRNGVLDFLRGNQDWLSNESFGRRIQILLRELNLLGGVAVLDALPPSHIHSFLETVGRRLAGGENAGEEIPPV